DRFERAWNFACAAHRGQLVPGSDLPYVNHVGNVAAEVLAAIALHPVGRPDLAVQCALLHDVIEDTEVTGEALAEVFGPEVAAGVRALSKDPSLPTQGAQMADSLRRLQAQPPEVGLVKLADRITNLQPPPGHWSRVKIAAYRDEAVEIHRALGATHPVLAARLLARIEAYRVHLGGAC
ncbi:MAG: HD domain-containing protein, partial [Deferrisomatales bacterium]